MNRVPTALIAEDEPLLAAALRAELARAWPELRVLATVGDGAAAVAQAHALRPDVLFLDIRMPGQNGLDAAAELAEDWPAGQALPVLVFVTAFDAYAVQAFDAQAVDYLLKPVTPERLARTVLRVQQRLSQLLPAPQQLDQTLAQLRALLAGSSPAAPGERLSVIQASVGNTIRLLPIGEVLVFEAADKYLRVLTADQELLIRTPLRELLAQLDPAEFWQIHRGTVVRANAIESATRDETGKLFLRLRGRVENWPVSRLYAVRFRAM